MNRYDELAPVREDVEKYLLPHEIVDEFPVRLYNGEFEKIPVWVYWHQGFGSAPDIVKLCVASIIANIPNNCELILLDKYNIDRYTKIPDYVTQKTKTNYTHSSNMLRAALLYLYGGMWLDATFLLTEPIPASCFERDFWSLKNKVVNPDDETDYIEQFAMECMYSEPNNSMLLYIYNMLCNYWRYNDTLYHYFLKDGIIDYGYNNNEFPRRYLDDLPYTNPNRFSFNADRMNHIYTPQSYTNRIQNTVFFKETYKFGIEYKEHSTGRITFYDYFKWKYMPDQTDLFSQKRLKEEIKKFDISDWERYPEPKKVYSKKFDKIPVWTMWYQGEERAPDIVKICLASMRANLDPASFEIIFIDKNNINDYIELPQYILDRVGTDYAHLSDIVKSALLYNYGGIWADATCLFTDKKSIKNLQEIKSNNDISLYLYKAFCCYWDKNLWLTWCHLDKAIYYIGLINKYFNANNESKKKYSLNLYGFIKLNQKYSKHKLDTESIFKLSYKKYELLKEYDEDNNLSYYGYFKNKYLNEKNDLMNETNTYSLDKIKKISEDIEKLFNEVPWEDVVPKKIYNKKFNKIPVWVLWYQGIDVAPSVVKCCIASLREHFNPNDFEIIILDKNNLSEYVQLKRNNITYTHLSDFLRCYLLYAYGGMYIDATYLFTKDYFTKELLQDKEFYGFTYKYNEYFTSFFNNICYSKPNNDMFLFIYQGLVTYWKNRSEQRHYYLIDGIYYYGYIHNKFNTTYINKLPQSEYYFYNFYKNDINRTDFIDVINKEPIHKLTYKFNNFKENKNNKITLWGYIFNKYLKGENNNDNE